MALTYDALATTTLSTATNVIQFTSITSTYNDLRLVCYLRYTAPASTLIRFNADTNVNYNSAGIVQSNTTFSTGTFANSTAIQMYPNLSSNTTSATNSGVFAIIDIIGYSMSSWSSKYLYLKSGYMTTSSSGSGFSIVGGNQTTIQTISAISLTTNNGNFGVGSIVTLYGIKGA